MLVKGSPYEMAGKEIYETKLVFEDLRETIETQVFFLV